MHLVGALHWYCHCYMPGWRLRCLAQSTHVWCFMWPWWLSNHMTRLMGLALQVSWGKLTAGHSTSGLGYHHKTHPSVSTCLHVTSASLDAWMASSGSLHSKLAMNVKGCACSERLLCECILDCLCQMQITALQPVVVHCLCRYECGWQCEAYAMHGRASRNIAPYLRG